MSYSRQQQQPPMYEDDYNNMIAARYVDENKLPTFLQKLWEIVDDPNYYDIVRWDDSGYSFHITDPYTFCRNVLPQYFKHNNLNSLIRQLNMYGFRKRTPIERSSLARSESDQDHLEFMHPKFVRNHPELLCEIKRKNPCPKPTSSSVSNSSALNSVINNQPKDLTAVFEELRQLRERQKNMETKMNEIIKENEMIWNEMEQARGTHIKQQKIVRKLVQFLVALVHPNNKTPRLGLGKRNYLAINDPSSSPAKRMCLNSNNYNDNNSFLPVNPSDMLDSLVNELSSEGLYCDLPSQNALTQIPVTQNRMNQRGPIIADVTDEMNELTTNALQQRQYSANPSRASYSNNSLNNNNGTYARKIMTPIERIPSANNIQSGNRKFYHMVRRPDSAQQQAIVSRKYSGNVNQPPAGQQVVYQNRQPYSLVTTSNNYNIPSTTSLKQPPTLADLQALDAANQNVLIQDPNNYNIQNSQQQQNLPHQRMKNNSGKRSVDSSPTDPKNYTNAPIVYSPSSSTEETYGTYMSQGQPDLLHENDAMLNAAPSQGLLMPPSNSENTHMPVELTDNDGNQLHNEFLQSMPNYLSENDLQIKNVHDYIMDNWSTEENLDDFETLLNDDASIHYDDSNIHNYPELYETVEHHNDHNSSLTTGASDNNILDVPIATPQKNSSGDSQQMAMQKR